MRSPRCDQRRERCRCDQKVSRRRWLSKCILDSRCCRIRLRAERRPAKSSTTCRRRQARQAINILNRFCPATGPFLPSMISALAAFNHRDGRDWPISRRANSRLTYRDQLDREPGASASQLPHSRLTRPVSTEALWLWDETGKSGWPVSTLIPNGRARPSGRNGTAGRQSGPYLRPYRPPWPGSLSSNS
jgi:hypothetical protein